MNRLPRVPLRTIFIFFFCAAVGLTCAKVPRDADANTFGIYQPQWNWEYAFLSAASVGIVIGLLQQARQLNAWKVSEVTGNRAFRFARVYAVAWRLAIVLILITCVVTTMLIARSMLTLPESESFLSIEIFPDAVWLACVVVSLSASLAKQTVRALQCESRWRTTAVWIVGIAWALIILPRIGIISFLVHLGIAGIEANLPSSYQRAGAYPSLQLEGFRLFWLSTAAVLAVILAAAVLIHSFPRHLNTRGSQSVRAAGFVGLLTVAGLFCVWYFCVEYYRVSPELAGAGTASNWLEWLGGSVLATMFVSAGAYRLARSEETIPAAVFIARAKPTTTWFHESPACLMLLLGAVSAYFIETIVLIRGITGGLGRAPFWDLFSWVIEDGDAYLPLAVGILTIQLCWVNWSKGSQTTDWKLFAIEPKEYFIAWLGLALLVLVGIPTISAFCFIFWLGPWYL